MRPGVYNSQTNTTAGTLVWMVGWDNQHHFINITEDIPPIGIRRPAILANLYGHLDLSDTSVSGRAAAAELLRICGPAAGYIAGASRLAINAKT